VPEADSLPRKRGTRTEDAAPLGEVKTSETAAPAHDVPRRAILCLLGKSL